MKCNSLGFFKCNDMNLSTACIVKSIDNYSASTNVDVKSINNYSVSTVVDVNAIITHENTITNKVNKIVTLFKIKYPDEKVYDFLCMDSMLYGIMVQDLHFTISENVEFVASIEIVLAFNANTNMITLSK